MKTDDLITVLASQAEPVDPRGPARSLAAAALLGLCIAVTLAAWRFGFNPRIESDSQLLMFWVRAGFAALLALGAAQLVDRLGRPGAQLRSAGVSAALALLGIWVLAAFALTNAAPDERVSLMLGSTWKSCSSNIALLSLPAFVLLLAVLRSFAPTRPRAAGAAAGALAGALGVLAYCIHCPELEASFIATWYVLGVAIPAAIGAAIGPRVLRW